jgi:hypothetical protein
VHLGEIAKNVRLGSPDLRLNSFVAPPDLTQPHTTSTPPRTHWNQSPSASLVPEGVFDLLAGASLAKVNLAKNTAPGPCAVAAFRAKRGTSSRRWIGLLPLIGVGLSTRAVRFKDQNQKNGSGRDLCTGRLPARALIARALQNLRTATIGSKQMASAPPALGGSRPAQLGSQRHLAEIDDATADLDRCG